MIAILHNKTSWLRYQGSIRPLVSLMDLNKVTEAEILIPYLPPPVSWAGGMTDKTGSKKLLIMPSFRKVDKRKQLLTVPSNWRQVPIWSYVHQSDGSSWSCIKSGRKHPHFPLLSQVTRRLQYIITQLHYNIRVLISLWLCISIRGKLIVHLWL